MFSAVEAFLFRYLTVSFGTIRSSASTVCPEISLYSMAPPSFMLSKVSLSSFDINPSFSAEAGFEISAILSFNAFP